MGVSIKDIATALNLSKATVSWILSGQGKAKGFSPKTIKRVKEYASSVNYQPNLVARSLSLGFSKTLGLIIPFLRDSFYAQLAYYIEKEAAKSGYSLIVCSSEGNGDKEYDLIHALISKRVDGMIIAPAQTELRGIEFLQNQQFPFVLVDRFFQTKPTNYVIVDNFQGSYDLVHFLARKGTSQIAILITEPHLYVIQQRIEGYRKALQNAGLKANPDLEIPVNRQTYRTDIFEKLDLLFQQEPNVNGFFFVTHYLAMEAIRYFISKGINYHQFHMGSFHTMDGLDALAPDMSASVFPLEELGEKSVRILLDNIATGSEYKQQGHVLQNKFLRTIGRE